MQIQFIELLNLFPLEVVQKYNLLGMNYCANFSVHAIATKWLLTHY